MISALSESSKKYLEGQGCIKTPARAKNQPDIEVVTADSFIFNLNLLAKYCKFGTPACLTNESMGTFMQGPHHVISGAGHSSTWNVSESESETGNSLINHPDLDQLRSAHRVHIDRYGVVSLIVRPFTASIVCIHAEQFGYGTVKNRIIEMCKFI